MDEQLFPNVDLLMKDVLIKNTILFDSIFNSTMEPSMEPTVVPSFIISSSSLNNNLTTNEITIIVCTGGSVTVMLCLLYGLFLYLKSVRKNIKKNKHKIDENLLDLINNNTKLTILQEENIMSV